MESIVKAITSPKKKLKLDPLDLLANAELGDAREMLSEQLQSPSARTGLRNLYFHKSGTNGEFILCRDIFGSEFVMMARIDEANKKFDIYRRKPTEAEFVEGVPDAKLTWNKEADKWMASVNVGSLVCDECAFRRRDEESSVSSTKFVTVLDIGQGMEKIHAGQHWFWLDMSGQLTECGDRRILECKHCDVNIENRWSNSGPLSPPTSPRSAPKKKVILSVRSKAPTLSPKGNLSVRFIAMDRTILPSARNVQCYSTEDQVCFQFLKLSSTKFAIDYRAPLSPLQAFCAALSTHFWI